CDCARSTSRSFPTRRSSDLDDAGVCLELPAETADEHGLARPELGVLDWSCAEFVQFIDHESRYFAGGLAGLVVDELNKLGTTPRSEEHTSELQSQSNLVCRL